MDIEVERLKNTVFGDGLGFISKIICPNHTKYTATIMGDGVYYKAVVYKEGEMGGENLIIKMLESIKLNGDVEKTYVDSFELNLDDERYYSSDMEGVSIICPEKWNPSEGMAFTNHESILSIMISDNIGTVTVKCYPKEMYDFEDYDDFIVSMIDETYNRGIINEINKELINITRSADTGRMIVFYKTQLVVAHFLAEYEDAYYCIESVCVTGNKDLFEELITISDSFKAAGDEIPFS